MKFILISEEFSDIKDSSITKSSMPSFSPKSPRQKIAPRRCWSFPRFFFHLRDLDNRYLALPPFPDFLRRLFFSLYLRTVCILLVCLIKSPQALFTYINFMSWTLVFLRSLQFLFFVFLVSFLKYLLSLFSSEILVRD